VKVLIDVNVFEDVFRQRDGWQASAGVLSAISKGQIDGCVSALTPPILYFFRKRSRGERASRLAVQGILRKLTIVALDAAAIDAAYSTALPDFEDALQFEAAVAASVDVIVTRNKRDFRQERIDVLTPEETLERLSIFAAPE
jgi:predicted nucleic acid-binding protein